MSAAVALHDVRTHAASSPPVLDAAAFLRDRELLQLVSDPLGGSPRVAEARRDAARRIFELDARFERGGAWAGVEDLIEAAYRELSELGEEELLKQHGHELYMVLLGRADEVRPERLCLTDTAKGAERTRFYALDRSYRFVHGLVGLVLKWRSLKGGAEPWLVLVRDFDGAQHLARRFFAELARRAAPRGGLDVVVEVRHGAQAARSLPNVSTVAAVHWLAELPRAAAAVRFDEQDVARLAGPLGEIDDLLMEQAHPILLERLRARGDEAGAAQVALRMLLIYNRKGFYHESKTFLDLVLAHFDELTAGDESKRMGYVSEINSCLVMTGDAARSVALIEQLAAPHLSMPRHKANMRYMLAMNSLRYAERKDLESAERHILQAADHVRDMTGDPSAWEQPFLKAFIDNGLAFLRVRQGRHEEAIGLCQAGYRSLTGALGEDRHLLHRSVLQSNTAQVYSQIGRLDDAAEYFGKAILLDPYYSEFHAELGNILQKLNRYDEAVGCYVRAIEHSAPCPEIYFNKAVCHARQELWLEALDDFAASLELQPGQAEIRQLRGEVYEALGRNDEALAEYDAAIALAGDLIPARVNRAVRHYNDGSYARALADMDHVVSLDARNPDHYENRAAVHRAMGREDLSLADLEIAERLKEAA